jgi:glyoxylase I family protein
MKFRNSIESGPGGLPIQADDSEGNPIELFQPADGSAPSTGTGRGSTG